MGREVDIQNSDWARSSVGRDGNYPEWRGEMKYYEPRWSQTDLVLAFLAGLIFVTTQILYSFVDEFEGWLRPVMSPLELTELVGADQLNGFTVWEGEAHKLRDCNYVRTEWFLGPRDGRRVQVRVSYGDKPEVRGAGLHYWSSIQIQLSELDVRSNSHADVIHECPNTLWETRTPFYDHGL